MGHRTMIDGTVRQVSGGRGLVGSAAYGIKSGRTLCQGTSYVIPFGKPIGDLPVGTGVYLNEAGVPAEYLVANQGNPDSAIYDASCDGIWLLRKDIYGTREWDDSTTNSSYEDSTIHAYLNSTFLNLFASDIQETIKQVKIPYRPGTGDSRDVSSGANGLPAKVFLLSASEVGIEVGLEGSFMPIGEGTKLSYFDGSSDKRIAYLRGRAAAWWLRSPYCISGGKTILTAGEDGIWGYSSPFSSKGIRPALIMPSDIRVNDDMLIVA